MSDAKRPEDIGTMQVQFISAEENKAREEKEARARASQGEKVKDSVRLMINFNETYFLQILPEEGDNDTVEMSVGKDTFAALCALARLAGHDNWTKTLQQLVDQELVRQIEVDPNNDLSQGFVPWLQRNFPNT